MLWVVLYFSKWNIILSGTFILKWSVVFYIKRQFEANLYQRSTWNMREQTTKFPKMIKLLISLSPGHVAKFCAWGDVTSLLKRWCEIWMHWSVFLCLTLTSILLLPSSVLFIYHSHWSSCIYDFGKLLKPWLCTYSFS